MGAAIVVAANLHQATRWKAHQPDLEARCMHVVTRAEQLRGHSGPLVVLTGTTLPQDLWEQVNLIAAQGGIVHWE